MQWKIQAEEGVEMCERHVNRAGATGKLKAHQITLAQTWGRTFEREPLNLLHKVSQIVAHNTNVGQASS